MDVQQIKQVLKDALSVRATGYPENRFYLRKAFQRSLDPTDLTTIDRCVAAIGLASGAVISLDEVAERVQQMKRAEAEYERLMSLASMYNPKRAARAMRAAVRYLQFNQNVYAFEGTLGHIARHLHPILQYVVYRERES